MHILLDGHDVTLVGGIEAFVASLANAMTQRGHNVFLFTYAPQGSRPHFSLAPGVTLVHYLFTGSQAHIPGLRRQILACEPDVFISPAAYNNHLLWCAALAGTDIPWICSEHTDPRVLVTERWNAAERNAVLCGADRIHLLLEKDRESVPIIVRKRVCTIPHSVDIPILSGARRPEHPTLLSLGRLHKVKQISLLLEAFALLRHDFPQWRLEIWGDGEERRHLQRQIAHLGLQGCTRLCGQSATPEQEFATADLFCIPSRYEGFGRTVIEAFANALPVVGFAGCAALNGIIRPGETGLLAPEMTSLSLAETLRPLMEDANLRHCMGENARIAATRYTGKRIFDAWEALLRETADFKGQTALQRCLTADIGDSEMVEHNILLREILQRENVLLRNDQWLRRLVRRNLPLMATLRSVRRGLQRFREKVRS